MSNDLFPETLLGQPPKKANIRDDCTHSLLACPPPQQIVSFGAALEMI